MSKEDEEKTVFITPCGKHCFVRMPSGLKSVGSMFARAMLIGVEPDVVGEPGGGAQGEWEMEALHRLHKSE